MISIYSGISGRDLSIHCRIQLKLNFPLLFSLKLRLSGQQPQFSPKNLLQIGLIRTSIKNYLNSLKTTLSSIPGTKDSRVVTLSQAEIICVISNTLIGRKSKKEPIPATATKAETISDLAWLTYFQLWQQSTKSEIQIMLSPSCMAAGLQWRRTRKV